MTSCEDCVGNVGDVASMTPAELRAIPVKCVECMTVEEYDYVRDKVRSFNGRIP